MKLKEHEGIVPMKTEVIKANEKPVIIAGVEIKGYQLADGTYKTSLNQVLEAFSVLRGRESQELRQRLVPYLQPQTLKVNRGKGKGSFQVNSTYLLTIEEVNQFLGALAAKGNMLAVSVLVALATETWQRRFDLAFGVIKTEVEYEATLANLYRRLRDEHKKQYIPYLTHWTKVDYPKGSAINYGIRTNQLKVAAGIRSLAPVDYMTTEELMVWNAAEIRYDAFRRAGYWHERALKEIATSV